MPRPKGLLIDLGGTILKEAGFDATAGTAQVLGLARDTAGISAFQLAEFARELNEESEPRREESMIEFRVQQFQRLLYERFGIAFRHSHDELELEFWKGAMRMEPEPGVATALESLARHGLPMGVLSNSAFSGRVLAHELARHGLAKRFAFVMSSADYGFRKPHPLLFATAVARLGLQPPEVWFVGDSPRHDIGGALNAGLVAVYYNPRGLPRNGSPPDHEVRSWAEFAELVGRLL